MKEHLEKQKLDFVQAKSTSKFGKRNKLLVVMFHGYGADAYDLMLLKELIRFPDHYAVDWIFPQGPLSVPIGPGWMGRAWWPVDLPQFENAVRTKNLSSLAQNRPHELGPLKHAIESIVRNELDYPWSQVILGGFSQGAMLATHIFLQAPEPPFALLSFSGALINVQEWQAAANRPNRYVFLSHGQNDPILDFSNLHLLEQLFNQKGCITKPHSFVGGHEIPSEVIQDFNTWNSTWFHHSIKS